jgi:hypothetical protein
MTYILLATLLLFVALLALYSAYLLLKCRFWFTYWLKGSVGILLIGLVAILSVLAFDILSYKTDSSQQSLTATIRFQKMGSQHYNATFTQGNTQQHFMLYGDQWQINARAIQWSSNANKTTGYRLHRLAGRYLSLRDEHNKPKRSYLVNQSYGILDVWSWLQHYSVALDTIVKARYTNDIFLPMSDDAYYQITLDNNKLLALPLNPSAKADILLWQ